MKTDPEKLSTAKRLALIKKLFSRPLPSSRTGAFYNAFSYQTKISPEAIAVYIASLTNPGDTVLDPFGGSGSTSMAALLCEHPTEAMLALAKELKVDPKWGARNAVSYELGTYGAFAANTIMSRLSAKDYLDAVDDFLRKANRLLSHMYQVKDVDGQIGEIRYVIWSEVLVCPSCQKDVLYFDAATKRDPVVFLDCFMCPHCGKMHNVDECAVRNEEWFDPLLHETVTRKKRVPAWIYGTSNGVNWDRRADKAEAKLFDDCVCSELLVGDTPRVLKWGDLWRSGYHFGITHLHHFYTMRNYTVMLKLWSLASKYSGAIADALHLLLLSYNASHCTLMTRVVAKKDSKDFVLTGAQSGVLYISKLPVEKNILLGLKRKAKPFAEVFGHLEKCSGKILVHNATSEKVQENDESIDYVFTDPPFGDFIPYAEVNQINELWLHDVTNRDHEVIISQSQGKTVDRYGDMLSNVFKEIGRVLKKESLATIVFHAAKANVWNVFASAVKESRLQIDQTNILDKKQSSFKQVVSQDSVQGDPMLLLRKASRHSSLKVQSDNDVLRAIVRDADNEDVDERRIYSMYVNKCLLMGMPIALDAKEAYREIEKIRLGD